MATPVAASTSEDCKGGAIIGGCSTINANVDHDQVTLSGSASSGGGHSGAGRGSGTKNSGGSTSGQAAPPRTPPLRPPDHCLSVMATTCSFDGAAATPASAAAPAARPLTIRDLAAFRPAPGRQQMEPNGWVVAGLDANFFAIVDQQLVPGTLLGQPATVRFTPVAYRWSYGDGSSAIRSTKGGTWASLGLQDFDPTATSHVYGVEGDYVIRLSIDFRAEYQFGSSSFIPVAGTITLPANDLRVTVTGAKTVLVDHDCVANPSGPGC